MNNVKNKVAICEHCHTYIAYLNLYMDEWNWYHISIGGMYCKLSFNTNVKDTLAEPEDIPKKIKPIKPRGR